MKKKILFGIFFVSIFLLSTATVVQPARGYEFGVPEQAVGMTGESEVKVYDEDEWEKHFGKKGSKPDDVFSSGMDEAGATGKSTVLEIETDEDLIAFLDDHLFEEDTSKEIGAAVGNPDWEPTVGEALTLMDNLMRSLTNNSLAKEWLTLMGVPSTYQLEILLYNLGLTSGMVTNFVGVGVGLWDYLLPLSLGNASVVNGQAALGIMNETEIVRLYGEKYDGTYVHTDDWDYISPGEEFDADPDDEDEEGPFLADPRDWYDPVAAIRGPHASFTTKMNNFLTTWESWWLNMNGTLAVDPLPGGFVLGNHPYKAYNDSLAALATGMGLLDDIKDLLDKSRNITEVTKGQANIVFEAEYDFVYSLYDFIKGLLEGFVTIEWQIIPNKQGLFYLYMILGLPTYTPTLDYLEKVFDIFKVDKFDDVVFNNLYYLWGYPLALDVDLEGTTVVIDVEFEPEDPIDLTTFAKTGNPADIDPDDTLSDFTMKFEYGEYGTQGTVTFEDDGEIFYQKGGVDQIPGYEVTIIVGVSALSILALIYVIMKKRKM
jgi:hypothetical protein